MRIVDPGHRYDLAILDGWLDTHTSQRLTFVKRQGENYPGNNSEYPGTTLQEVLRACLDRVKYVHDQKHYDGNLAVMACLERAIWYLEERAAHQHRRTPPTQEQAVYGQQCLKCLHVGCPGDCH